MMKHKQVNDIERKKSNNNTVYISFSVYKIDVDIHHIGTSLCNGASITLRCQQIHNCGSQMRLHTQILRTAFQRKRALVRCSGFLQQMISENQTVLTSA